MDIGTEELNLRLPVDGLTWLVREMATRMEQAG
jgi:hypothetical protein